MKKDDELEEGRYARATMYSTFKMVLHNARVRLAMIKDFTGRHDIVSAESMSTALPKIRLRGQTQRDQDGSQRKLGSS